MKQHFIPRMSPLAGFALLSILFLQSQLAQAHGIAGNRFFPGTLTFDDPAVADEFSLTTGTTQHPFNESNVKDHTTTIAFARLLTPEISIGFDSGIVRRDWGSVQRTGVTGTNLTLKYSAYRDKLNETLVATSITYGIIGSGEKSVGANNPP